MKDLSSENLHTISQLKQKGNKLIELNESSLTLIMRRGKTWTLYGPVERQGITYWTPLTVKSYA